MPPPGDQPNDRPPDTRPFLSIPYWTAPLTAGGSWDTGSIRPLPGEVASYTCESIHTSSYKPGHPLEVAVDVRNSGGGNSTAIVTVVVYWAIPSVGFAKPTFFAATVVAVPPSRTSPDSVRSPTMTATIPANAPAHICLLVCVSHPQDRPGIPCDPVHDRHWAQHNLVALAASAGAPARLPILVANPFNKAMSFVLRVNPVDERRRRRVANALHTEPSGAHSQVGLLDDHGSAVSDVGQHVQTSVHLGPLEQRKFQITIRTETELHRGESAAVEVGLYDNSPHQDLVGSLGVALLALDEG
jgi:hypothetical protein